MGTSQPASPHPFGASSPPTRPSTLHRPTAPRRIATFLNELHTEREQQHPDITSALSQGDDLHRSQDLVDPITTNIFVGNLDPGTDERRLLETFAVYGPVESVKVMWPRTEAEFARGWNCGFVAFMSRGDAEDAYSNLHRTEIDGRVVKLSWGKAVLRLGRALPLPEGMVYGGSAKVELESDEAIRGIDREKKVVLVQPPVDLGRRALLDALAENVVRVGAEFEKAISERERERAEKGEKVHFRFLFDEEEGLSDDAIYYKWRIYSLANGDTLTSWRTSEFAVYDGGPAWIPPPCGRPINNPKRKVRLPSRLPPGALRFLPSNSRLQATTEDQSAILKQLETTGPRIPSETLSEFTSCLRDLTTDRNSLGKTMVFCIDHAHYAGPIIVRIVNPLLQQETPLPKLLSHLYLASDILHNSATHLVRSAWSFRTGFYLALPHIFACLGARMQRISGIMARHRIKEAVKHVLKAWEAWALYDQEFVGELNRLFLGNETTVATAEGGLESIAGDVKARDQVDEDEDVDGEDLDVKGINGNSSDGRQRTELSQGGLAEESEEEDIDGEPID